MKKLILFCSLVSYSLYAGPTIYNTVQKINLASLEWIDEEWPNERYGDYIQRCLRYQMHPQAIIKRKKVFELFENWCNKNPSPAVHNALSDITTLYDLNILSGKEAHKPYLAEILDRTRLELARVFFYCLLAQPTNDVALLKKRQEIIRFFLEHPDFNSVFDEHSNIAESITLSFWARDGFAQITERNYYKMPYLEKFNQSPAALEFKYLLDHQQRFTYVATTACAGVILPLFAFYALVHWPKPAIIDNIGANVKGSGGVFLSYLSNVSNTIVASAATWITGIYACLSVKETAVWAKDNITLDRCLHTKMYYVGQFFNKVRNLAALIKAHPLLCENFSAAKTIVQFFDENVPAHKDLSTLFNLLGSATFQQEKFSALSYHGRMYAAFALMNKVKEEIEPLLLALGEFDAYRAIATLYKEYEDTPNKFCFVDFKQSATPYLHMQELWNPFIDTTKAVANDVLLQGDSRNMIITGPNAGGKSTLIKSIANNVILAQSIGIAAAQTMELSVFYSIATYLNIVDDIASGNSLFKAQVLRAAQIMDIVRNTPADQYNFIALDEMFNGTSSKESKVAAYAVANHIGQFTNTLCVLATHFPLLTQLVKENPAYSNYKVSVNVDPLQGIHYPFKLEKGISHQHIALDILKEEGYANTIVDDALMLLNKKNT